jgi:hypothetical protein
MAEGYRCVCPAAHQDLTPDRDGKLRKRHTDVAGFGVGPDNDDGIEDRLGFSSGIILLSVAAAFILAAFDAKTNP